MPAFDDETFGDEAFGDETFGDVRYVTECQEKMLRLCCANWFTKFL